MAKATIVLEDDAQTDEVRINVDFDPPITDDMEPSHAANMAVMAIKHLQESYGKDDEEATE